jgi:hypothetical protein
MFISNFQGTYERPSTAETLKTIKQKYNERLWDYLKHFCNARNAIFNIKDIEIINTFLDGVTDIMTVEEITNKKAKTVADLLAVVDECIKAYEARAQLLDAWNKGSSKKKKQEDREVNTIDHGNKQQPLTDLKKRG